MRAVEIRLTDGRVALVSPEDAHLAQYSWVASDRSNGRTYAQRNVGPDNGTIYLHREVLGLRRGDGKRVDHRDGDGLNCQRWNLRPATNSQNLCNQARHGQAFKGISRSGKRWKALIRIAGVLTYLGTYDTPEDAARAYDAAARKHFGEWACVNYPNPGERGCRAPIQRLPAHGA